jgi:uncharacterized damage-inducible protein DinB
MRDHLKRLLSHNHEANRRFIDAVLGAGPAGERVAAILSHILNAHRIWNARLGGVSPVGDPREVRPADAWAPMDRENFERSVEVVEHADLARVVEYRDTKGNPHRNRAGDILLQVVTHSSYHRGQLALLLGQGGQSPPATDYIFYLREDGP